MMRAPMSIRIRWRPMNRYCSSGGSGGSDASTEAGTAESGNVVGIALVHTCRDIPFRLLVLNRRLVLRALRTCEHRLRALTDQRIDQADEDVALFRSLARRDDEVAQCDRVCVHLFRCGLRRKGRQLRLELVAEFDILVDLVPEFLERLRFVDRRHGGAWCGRLRASGASRVEDCEQDDEPRACGRRCRRRRALPHTRTCSA